MPRQRWRAGCFTRICANGAIDPVTLVDRRSADKYRPGTRTVVYGREAFFSGDSFFQSALTTSKDKKDGLAVVCLIARYGLIFEAVMEGMMTMARNDRKPPRQMSFLFAFVDAEPTGTSSLNARG
jgi:hypothetical protein